MLTTYKGPASEASVFARSHVSAETYGVPEHSEIFKIPPQLEATVPVVAQYGPGFPFCSVAHIAPDTPINGPNEAFVVSNTL